VYTSKADFNAFSTNLNISKYGLVCAQPQKAVRLMESGDEDVEHASKSERIVGRLDPAVEEVERYLDGLL
jgi:hypothetical protein